jgi:type I restriction enzyme S subunit
MSREVPEGWNQLSLGDICTGGMLTDGDWIESKDQDPDGQIRLLQLSDIGDGEFLNKTRRFINEQTAERLKVTYLEKHDILLARMPDPLGRSCLLPLQERAITAVDVCVIRPSAATDRSWLSYLLNSPEIRALINAQGTGTTRTRVSRKTLAALALMVPPLHEQRRIAEILSSVDEAIAATRAVIEQTRKVKQGVLERLLSRGIGHTRFKQTEIGEIPERWEVVELQNVASVRTGLAKNKKEISDAVELPYLRVANVQDGYVDLSDLQTISVSRSQVERYSLRKGDVLMTEGGDYDKLGRGDVWDGSVEPCLHQNHVFAVRADQERLIPEFLANFTASRSGKAYFQSCSKRSTNLASINSKQVKQFPVRLPGLSEQSEIVRISKSFDASISVGTSRLSQQRHLKSALMSDLLTGRRRVTDALPMAAE